MKLGFIDHHLNNYHANKFHDILKQSDWAADTQIVAAYESHPTGDDWCVAKGIPRAASPAEVVKQCDAVLVLAPDDVDAHLELGREALQSGKPVFMDKTLSSTVEDALAIVELSKKHNSPVMSSSSLRFSVELEEMLVRLAGQKLESIFSRGFGKWRGYAVHTTSPVLRLLTSRITRVLDTGSGAVHFVTAETKDGQRAQIDLRQSENQMEATPWQVGALVGGKYEVIKIARYDEFYANLMKEAVGFFRSGKSPIPVEEQLDTVALEVAAEQSSNKGGQWVDVTW